MNTRSLVLGGIISLIATHPVPSLWAEVVLPRAIGSNMVIQRDRPASIWGWAGSGEPVTVKMDGNTVATTVGLGGDRWWRVQLPPQKAGKVADVVISGSANTVTLTNLLAGEVWLCSGQSNMVMTVVKGPWCGYGGVQNAEKEAAGANHPEIRLFTVENGGAMASATDVKGAWAVCGPDSLPSASATAYFFGRELQAKLNIPVGLVISAVGGTAVEPWTPLKALENDADYAAMSSEAKKLQAELGPQADADRKLEMEWRKQAAAASAKHEKAPAPPVFKLTPAQRFMMSDIGPILGAGGLYNGKIHPLTPMTIAGAIWYQGESNARRGEHYAHSLGKMIEGWRSAFNQPLPFLEVQLANFGTPMATDSHLGSFALLREAQEKAAATVPNTGIAAAVDIGMPGNIHPTNKQEVGRRLAQVALKQVYGKNVTASGPRFAGASFGGGKAVVRFAEGAGQLVLKGTGGFEIAGEDRNFVSATASIRGDTVEVSSPSVAKPVAVRYAFLNAPETSLFNAEGWPAFPFRSDSWNIAAKPETAASLTWPGSTTDTWHGYMRHNFTVAGCQAWVVEPRQAAPGNRWSWCLMFPDAFTERCAATQLLAAGYFHAYIAVGNTFGCPKAIAQFNEFYQKLTAAGLGPKPVLIGISRGGLYSYRWAAENSGKVGLIYGDAPVCDFKSWPGGKGKGKGSPGDWQALIACYGFANEAEALAYPRNPIDTLAPLAKAGVPLIHVVGDADDVVPVEENTAIVEKRYRELGGTIEVIHKPGVGHHPHGVDDPKPLVDFILHHAL